jgi:hypothetical protein
LMTKSLSESAIDWVNFRMILFCNRAINLHMSSIVFLVYIYNL